MNPMALLKIAGRLAARRIRQSPLVPKTTLAEEIADTGSDFHGWLEKRRSEARIYVEIGDDAVAALAKAYPQTAERTVAGADTAASHTFSFLGSGPFHSVDPERSKRANGYQPIDWYTDPVRKLRFPTGVHYKKWKLYEMRPGDADIKYPWELGRCQHFAALGQAYRLTRNERYAQEIVDQIDDFMEANPVGIGVNWTCTMDVAIRAANWVIGLALVKGCTSLTEDRLARVYGAVFEHGTFIYDNFENIYEVTSNHYLSNVVGLHFIAAEFIDLASGKAWDTYCRKSVETEIGVQILPDGADFESSVPYHRLVTELFLGCYRLAQFQGRPLSDAMGARLKDMGAYLAGVTRPDGLMPVLGDADDGRLHIFTDWASWNRQDGRHMVAAVGAVLKDGALAGIAGPAHGWEAGWWGCPLAANAPAPSGKIPQNVKLYPDAGAFIARKGGNYLLVTNAKVGTKGFGNHKHNEQLSFEYHTGGEAFVADPGSYVYTSDFAGRNLFRSTAYHSTLCVDGIEQNEFNPEWLFRMFEKAEAEHVGHGIHDTTAWYEGRHVGFSRATPPVIHARRFDLNLETGSLKIDDRLEGEGEHDLVWHFHLAPKVSVAGEAAGSLRLVSPSGRVVRLTYPASLKADISDGWYSPSYGARQPVKMIDLKIRCDVAANNRWSFALEPAAQGGA